MVQDEIFRFMNLRPVNKAGKSKIIRHFAGNCMIRKPALQLSIENLTGDDAYERSLELARTQLGTPRPDKHSIQLETLIEKATGASTVATAREIVRTETKLEPEALLKDPAFTALNDWYCNMLIAHSLLPDQNPEKREEIYSGIRAFHFLSILTQQKPEEKPLNAVTLKNVRPLVPRSIFLSPPQARSTEVSDELQALKEQWQRVREQISGITTTINEIRNGDRIMRARRLPEVQKKTEAREARPARPTRSAKVILQREELAGRVVASEKDDDSDMESTMMVRERIPSWVFSEESKKHLSEPVRAMLGKRSDQTAEMSVGALCGKLEAERYKLATDFLEDLPDSMMGEVDNLPELRKTISALAIPDLKFKIPFPKVIHDKSTPLGRGIKPLGIGDLLVVKQTLVKYEAGEVAHVENILKSEFKTRIHTRVNETESVEERSEESQQTSEKDTQSTERFELRAETESAIQEQTNVSAGVSVTAGYGPVSLSTHADFALSSSESESERTASTYAKDITGRAVSKIAQRVREQQRTRTLQRIEERNEHGFDNKEGLGHVIGVYRWLDKYYKARLINYGKRLMLEFIIPEPGAFYIRNQEKQEVAGVDVKKPRPPMIDRKPLSPGLLNKNNYMDFVAEYDVREIDPYPEDYISVSMSFGETVALGGNADFAKTYDTWVVPEGYEVEGIYGGACANGYPPKNINYSFAGVEFGGPVAGIEGVISVSVSGFLSAFQMNMVAVCRPTERSVAKWQLKSFQAIMKAYQTQLAAYREALAAAEIRAGVKIEGRNPGINRKIEADELRKGVLRILTNNFAKIKLEGKWRKNEEFNAMKNSDAQYGYPEFNVGEALIDGKIIQFFEQALEWPNMTYFFYPYFWARKSKWAELFPMSDPDPLFARFLRSGAARVIVPVQPEYTEVVLHYMGTNELWNGGQPPTINDELYISIVDEMRAENGLDADDVLVSCSADSGYPCMVDEWDVKLPTDLVYLQPDDSLPDFTK